MLAELEGNIILDYIEKLIISLDEVRAQEEKLKEAAWMLKDKDLVLTIGNGGSSSTAQHLAQGLCDAGIRAICLTDNTSLFTALSNDEGYWEALSLQVKLFANDKRDIVTIAISASGNSPNILNAVRVSNEEGVKTIGLIGFGGGSLKGIVDIPIILSSKDYGVVEDTHLAICHILCKLVKSE